MALEVSTYICIPVFVLLYLLTKSVLHKLQRLPPTPFPELPIIGHLHLLKKPLHQTLAKLSERHGKVLLLHFGSRCVLHVSSPLAAEECFTKNDIVFANRPDLLLGKYIGENYTSLPWVPYSDHFQNLRRISNMELLSSTRIDSLSYIRLEEIQSLTHRLFLTNNKNPNQILNLRAELFSFIFNVITRMIGGGMSYGLGGEISDKAKRYNDIVADTAQVNVQSAMADMLPIWWWFLGGKLEKRLISVQKRRDEFMQEWIDEIRADGLENKDGKKTILKVLLSLQDSDPEYFTDNMIKGLSQALLHGGINNSVDTMEWAMALLLNKPHVLKKAQTEIDNVVGCDRLVNEGDLSKLPYLQCIIKETLRIHPAGPLLIPHASSKECTVGGYRIPRGTMLLVNVWALQNDPDTWDCPEIFKPERFEVVKGNIGKLKEGLTMIPFGSGRRRCPGENLAMRTMGLGLASLIQCFDWKRVSDELVDMTESAGLSTPKAQPLMAKYQTRSTIARGVYLKSS